MTFSTDLTKPLSRAGLAINLVVLTALFYAVSAVSFKYMTVTLPHQGAAHHSAEVAEKTAAQTFEKAKKAAKGKAFDEKAAEAQARAAGEAEAKKQAEEIHHHAVSGWAPFAVFLLILSAVFFAGFLSVAVQRRANDAGLLGLWIFSNHLGAWLFAGFVAFYPFLAANGLRNAWSPVFIAGLVLLLPVILGGEGKGESADGHDHH
ncbi:MAG: hypothetical protein RL250_309 [Verrucomicrobiota bacterium]|jgi:hypothetical protein